MKSINDNSVLTFSKLSHGGVSGLGLETADTGIASTHVSNDSEISRFTPVGTPRVLKDPIVGGSISSVSNDEDGVVELSSTLG